MSKAAKIKEDGTVITVHNYRPVTDDNGIQHPRNIFQLWTDEELNAIGYAKFDEENVSSAKRSTGTTDTFADGRVQVRRLRITEESEILEKPLKDLDLPRGVLVGGVARGEAFHVPTGSDQLQSGDQLYLIGTSDDLDIFERLAGAVRQAAHRMALRIDAGGDVEEAGRVSHRTFPMCGSGRV